jgi:hypothetical protein
MLDWIVEMFWHRVVCFVYINEGVHFFSITLCNLAMFYFGIQISNNIVETTVCLQHVLYNEHDENLEFDISKQGSRDDIWTRVDIGYDMKNDTLWSV